MTAAPIAWAALAGAANLVGAGAVTSSRRWSIRALQLLVALSAGYMIAVALLEVIPVVIEQSGSVAAIGILAGYMLVHLTQHTLAPHFHFGEETHHVGPHAGVGALAGLMLHTFVDGVTI